MQNKQILWLCSLLLCAGAAQTQEIRVNERGEKIIVRPDGSWQYFTNFGVPSDALFDPKDSPNYKPAETGEKYPTFDGTVLPMDNVYASTDEDAGKIFIRRAQIANDAIAIARRRVSEATQQREKLEQELKMAQQQDAAAETIRQLNLRLSAARKTEDEARREADLAQQEARKSSELAEKGNYLKTLKAESNIDIARSSSELLEGDFYKNIIKMDESFTSINDVVKTGNTCAIAYEGNDETTRQWRRDLQQELLFTHTDERLRLYLKDKDYLRCEGFLTSTAGFRFLSLQFTFAYPNAREAYGFIEKNSVLIIKLLNGDFVTLRAGRMDKGRYDTEKEILTYQVHYPIDRGQLNTLRNSELDTVIMFWSSGYEEYDVFNLNFFKRQLACLER